MRVRGIDIVRGLAMVVMALDHVRDLFHAPSLVSSPTDLATTTPAIFLTRFVTHFCAPIFVFLAGTSAYLSLRKTGDVKAARRFLVKRGLWLTLLEFTAVNFGIWFDVDFDTILIQVIAAIGFGFIFLGLLLKWSPKTIGIIGIVLVLIQTILPILPVADGIAKTAISALFFPTAFNIGSHFILYAYPILSWTAILFMGFGTGKLFTEDNYQSRLLGLGSVLLASFILLRFFNIGDIAPWSEQKNLAFTVLSFLNVTKYPPTLLFCLLTLGVMFLLIWLSEKASGKVTSILETYGKVPMFYYLLHWYLIHITLLITLRFQGITFDEMDFSGLQFGRPKAIPSGLSLVWVYVVWIGIVCVLYFPVKWYARYKATHSATWLRYV